MVPCVSPSPSILLVTVALSAPYLVFLFLFSLTMCAVVSLLYLPVSLFRPRVFPVLVFLALSFSWGCPAIGGVIKVVPVGPDAPTLRASPEA